MAEEREIISRSQAMFLFFPGRFTMHDSILCRVQRTGLDRSLETHPPNEVSKLRLRRIDRRVRAEILRAEERYQLSVPPPPGQAHLSVLGARDRFELRRQRVVEYDLDPTVFVCPKCEKYVNLGDKIEKGLLKQNDLKCATCQIQLRQLPFVFVHPRCGSADSIRQDLCDRCRSPLTYLHLERENLYDSYWRCSKCGHSGQQLIQWCSTCRASGYTKADLKMRPVPAGSAMRPMAVTLVDIETTEDWRRVTTEWLNLTGVGEDEIYLAQFPAGSQLRKNLEETLRQDPEQRAQLIREDKEKRPEAYADAQDPITKELGHEPCDQIKDSLGEFYGAFAATERQPNGTYSERLRALVLKEFGFEVLYIPDLQIKRLLFGYLVGSSNVAEARLQLFGSPPTRYVLGDSVMTEGLLFMLSPERVAAWLSRLHGRQWTPPELKKHLVGLQASPEKDRTFIDVQTLLHTISHLLVRNAEIFSGVSREAFSELIFTPRLAMMIYSQDGGELGALRTTYESGKNLLNWFYAARSLGDACPHGDVCLEKGGACHACLYLAERCCTTLWNEQLDRRYVINSRDPLLGYWN